MEECTQSHVLLTDKIRRWIRTVLTTVTLPNETREELRKYTTSRRSVGENKPRTIPFELVKTVHSHLDSQEDGLYLHELLEGSDVSLPEAQREERSPELEARIQKLRNEQGNREYKEMTRNVNTKTLQESPYGTMGAEVKTMNMHIISVLNFVLTVGGAFVFGYKAYEYSAEERSVPMQIGMGMILATAVFIADMYFLIKADATEEKVTKKT